MPAININQDAIIVGGGFYGAAIAIYLAKQRGFKNIVLVEREAALLKRASYNNQARVHNGYHYPRSYTTAYRSRVNLPKFVRDWPDAVTQDFIKLYAIARRNSKVTAKQFYRFCREIGANITPAVPSLRSLFEPSLIEDVFIVEEYTEEYLTSGLDMKDDTLERTKVFLQRLIESWKRSEYSDADIRPHVVALRNELSSV